MKHPKRFLIVVLTLGVVAVLLAVRDRASDLRASAAAMDSSSPANVAVDDRRQQLIGVRTVRVARGSLASTLRTTGTVRFDESRLTDVNVKVDGWITDLFVSSVGQPVSGGQTLFTLFSQELIDAQNELLLGLKNREQLTEPGTVNQREFAQRVVEVPRLNLLRWDVPDDVVHAIEETRQPKTAVPFQSPTDGVVIEKTVVKGMHVERGQTLYRLADVSVVWIEANFHERDLAGVRVGAKADVTADAWPGESMPGRIDRVDPFVTESTRTVRARLSLENRDGRLKPGMFVRVDVSAATGEGLLIPADAVVDSGARQIVFVAQGQGHFEPRDVKVGSRASGQALILAGLHEGDEVATRATFFLDSESRMRGALEDYRAGSSGMPATEQPAGFDLTVETTPNPPRAGDNTIEVRVHDNQGRPVSDAQVDVIFSMAAMPSMNMPAMKSEARLRHVAGGVYRGPVALSMSGRWDVLITALRAGHAIADARTSFITR